MLSIAILDDERKVLDDYERIIPIWLKRNDIKGKIEVATTDPRLFMEEIREQKVNVCIIDINLKTETTGLQVAKCIRKENIQAEIIFATGLLEYIRDAFEVNAYNFIPKPINNQLEKCLVKLSKEIDSRIITKKTIDIKFGSNIYFVPLEEIMHIQRLKTKTIIQTINRRLEIYDSLEIIVERLNDERFKQCHRSIIVNQEHIDFIDIKNKTIVLKDGSRLEIGPKYYSNFKFKEDGGYCYAV
jgi:DNA-binding LytR/AlgR family response regulator